MIKDMIRQNRNFEKYLSLFLLLIIIFNLSFFAWKNKEVFLEKYDVDYWDKVYSVSQWKTPTPEEFINDAELYAVAGSNYIRGGSPTEINPEHPPLGKYLIGLSIVLFNNEKVVSLILGVLVLVLLFFLGREIFKKDILAWILVVLFSFEPLFREQFTTSMLDLPQLFFAIAAIVFFLKAQKNHRFYFLTSFSLGCVSATKTPVSAGMLIGFFLFYLLSNKDFKRILSFIVFTPLIFMVYFSSYIVHFFYNMNLGYFLRYHQWMFDWWTAGRVSWGRVWRMLFTGWWRTWWGEVEFIRFSSWTVFWPLLVFCSFLSIIFYWRNKKKEVLLIIFWVFGYLGFLSLIAVFPRYLLFIFPGLYILSLFVFMEIATILLPKKLIRKIKECFV